MVRILAAAILPLLCVGWTSSFPGRRAPPPGAARRVVVEEGPACVRSAPLLLLSMAAGDDAGGGGGETGATATKTPTRRQAQRRANRRASKAQRNRLGEQGPALRRRFSQNVIVNRTLARAVAAAALEGLEGPAVSDTTAGDDVEDGGGGGGDGWGVVELGAGLGSITEGLLTQLGGGGGGSGDDAAAAAAAARVLAVEIDRGAAALLSKRFPTLDVAITDLLELDWPAVRARFAARARGATDGGGDDELELSPPTDADPRLTVVSNLPFSLTSRALYSLLDAAPHLRRVVLIVQREVAERLVAAPGDGGAGGGGGAYSSLSVEFALRGRVTILDEPTRQSFAPVPTVRCAVVAIDFDAPRVAALAAAADDGDDAEREEWETPETHATRLRRLLAAAFRRRAKSLRYSWEPLLRHAESDEPLLRLDLLSMRPWQISPDEFGEIARLIPAHLWDEMEDADDGGSAFKDAGAAP